MPGATLFRFGEQLCQSVAIQNPFPPMQFSVPIVGALIGAVILFFGRKLFWLCVAAVGFAAGVEIAPHLVQEPSPLLALTVALVLGLIGVLLALFLQKIAIAVLRHLAAEVRRLSERVFEFSTMVVQNRVQAELVRLAGMVGQTDGEAVLSPAPSLSDIADRISTHREAVSRELSRLTALGLLRRDHGGLRITDIGRLTKLVNEAKGE